MVFLKIEELKSLVVLKMEEFGGFKNGRVEGYNSWSFLDPIFIGSLFALRSYPFLNLSFEGYPFLGSSLVYTHFLLF